MVPPSPSSVDGFADVGAKSNACKLNGCLTSRPEIPAYCLLVVATVPGKEFPAVFGTYQDIGVAAI